MLAVAEIGHGLPLLCIHGWTLNMNMWRAQHPLGDQGISLICYDRRGFGASTAPPDLARELDDINAIKTYFGWDQFALYGMSQGARIAMHYAAENPDAVSHLILQSAPADNVLFSADPDSVIPIGYYAELMGDGELEKVRAHWAAHPMMACDDPDVRAELETMVRSYQGHDLISRSHGLGNANPQKIRCASLVLCGSDEPAHLVDYSKDIAEKISDAKLLCLSGEGHFTNMTAASAVNAAIAAFLLPQAQKRASNG